MSVPLPSIIQELQAQHRQENKVVPSEEKKDKIVVLYSRDIPSDVRDSFMSFGKCLFYNHDVHSKYSIGEYTHDYIFFDVRRKVDRSYLQSIHEDVFKSLNVVVFCHEYEKVADIDNSFTQLADNVITSFPSQQAFKKDWDELLLKQKIKHYSRFRYLIQACLKFFK